MQVNLPKCYLVFALLHSAAHAKMFHIFTARILSLLLRFEFELRIPWQLRANGEVEGNVGSSWNINRIMKVQINSAS